jgi:hypothetical protein
MQKVIILSVALMTAHLSVLAQAAYKGGAGDGHAMKEVTNVFVQSVEETSGSKLLIFPNPCDRTSILHIENDDRPIILIRIISADGKVCAELNSLPSEGINVRSLNSGLYLLEVTTQKGKSRTRLVIK